MFYSPSTGGFYSAAVHGSNMPADVVEITAQEHADLLSGQSVGKVIVADEYGSPTLADQPQGVPQSVTMRQARLALLGAGLLQNVEAAIDAMDEPARTAARIEWDYSSEVFRSKPFVQQLGTALGLSSEEIDQLFIAAAGIE